MRDFPPEDKARRDHLLQLISDSYSRFGYRSIETAMLESIDVLSGGQGWDNEKLIYKVLKRGIDGQDVVRADEAVDLGLRFDLTLPLSRFYANNKAQLPAVFRSIQIGPVWRAERPQKGRYRQFTQCDIDVFGLDSPVAETELATATLFTLDRLGLTGQVLRLNDRRVLLGILSRAGVDPAAHARALIAVDKLDKIGVDGVLAELTDREIADPASVAGLADVLGGYLALGTRPAFDDVRALLGDSVEAAVLDNLATIHRAVTTALPGAAIDFDITLVRGMGYYTGPIFEVAHPESGSSIAGGGRYDGMVGRFLKESVSACGFSIGFERIVEIAAAAQRGEVGAEILLRDSDADLGVVMAHVRSRAEQGLLTRVEERPKRLGRALDGWAAEGFSHYVEAGVTDGLTAIGEQRPISVRAPGARE